MCHTEPLEEMSGRHTVYKVCMLLKFDWIQQACWDGLEVGGHRVVWTTAKFVINGNDGKKPPPFVG